MQISNTPRLRGAACQGSRYHDGETPQHVALAIEICSSCPALTPCTKWSRDEAGKRRTPIGMVTAGRHHQSTNPKKENQPC